MKLLTAFTAGTLLAVTHAGVVWGEDGVPTPGTTAKGSPGRPGSSWGDIDPTPWFSDQRLRQELRLGNEQFNRLNNVYTVYWERYSAGLNDAAKLNEQQRLERANELSSTFHLQMMKSADEILEPPQRQRFTQLFIQKRGMDAFSDADIQKRLNLTEEQRQKLPKHHEEYTAKLSAISKDLRNDRSGAAKRMSQLEQENMEWMNSLLTEEQRRIWREMIGEPYNFESRAIEKKRQ